MQKPARSKGGTLTSCVFPHFEPICRKPARRYVDSAESEADCAAGTKGIKEGRLIMNQGTRAQAENQLRSRRTLLTVCLLITLVVFGTLRLLNSSLAASVSQAGPRDDAPNSTTGAGDLDHSFNLTGALEFPISPHAGTTPPIDQASGRTKRTETSDMPMKISSAPSPIQRSTPVVPRCWPNNWTLNSP